MSTKLDLFLHPNGLHEVTSEVTTEVRNETNDSKIVESGVRALSPAELNEIRSRITLLLGRIFQELETQPAKLTHLNRSRREAVVQHLELYMGKSVQAPANEDRLNWVLKHAKEPECAKALRSFFEEIALVQIGMALVLKSWSDRKLRVFKKEDLSNLNWTLNTTLKHFHPLDSEGRQITRQNLYSWYIPGEAIRTEIWTAFQKFSIASVSSDFLRDLLSQCWQSAPSLPEIQSYDDRFFRVIHQWISEQKKESDAPTILPRPLKGFTPTLRAGKVIADSKISEWIGFEATPLIFLISELTQLWEGPSVAPLWLQGYGLDAYAGDQLNFELGSPIPSSQKKIREMEDFDVSILCEERTVRLNARATESVLLRNLADEQVTLKKIRSVGTSLGDLQAAVALSKLRPGGLLLWFREEPLHSHDGTELLHFLLEKSTLQCEWDLSKLRCEFQPHLLAQSMLYPKFLYCFKREIDNEKRLNHHPERIQVEGSLRSQIGLPNALLETLRSHAGSIIPGDQNQGLRITRTKSLTPQREWMERWPDPASEDISMRMAEIRNQTEPLATLAHIVPIQNFSHPRTGTFPLWVRFADKKLKVSYEPTLQSEYCVLPPSTTLRPILKRYLELPIVSEFIEFSMNQRGGKLQLQENDLKWIPVPKFLAKILNGESQLDRSEFSEIIGEILKNPDRIASKMAQFLESAGSLKNEWSTHLWAKLSQILNDSEEQLAQYSLLIDSKDQIQWSGIMGLLSQKDLTPMTIHPDISIEGHIPSYIPIVRIERTKGLRAALIFMTETQGMLTLSSEQRAWIDLLHHQLQGVESPTWSELTQHLKLPKSLDKIQTIAQDVLKSYQEHLLRHRALDKLVSLCPVY